MQSPKNHDPHVENQCSRQTIKATGGMLWRKAIPGRQKVQRDHKRNEQGKKYIPNNLFFQPDSPFLFLPYCQEKF